jgi:uncharacterized protein
VILRDRWPIFAAVLLLAFTPPTTAEAKRKTHAAMVLSSIDGQIVPRVKDLRKATAQLASGMKRLCAAPGKRSRKRAAARRFKKVVLAWGAVDFLRFGPITKNHRLERFFFWPDPRATTWRQLTALLAKKDPALLDPRELAKQSVAVQGLGALELILTDKKKPLSGRNETSVYRCAYAKTIADNLNNIAIEIEGEWTAPDGWRQRMLTPGSDNAIYKDASETAREIVKAILIGLQIAQERNIVPRLEKALGKTRKPLRVPFQKAGLTNPYLASRIVSIAAIFMAVDLTAYVPPDKAWMRKFILGAFKALVRDCSRLPKGKRNERVGQRGIDTLRKMRFDVNGLRQIIGRELAPAAELSIGFNALDGD